jgi:hypothetical protein
MKRTSVACSIEWISFRDSSALGSLGQELKLLIGGFPDCLGPSCVPSYPIARFLYDEPAI